MYNDEYTASAAGAAAKASMLRKNPLGYFLLSALAGAYIGFGILLSFTVSGTLGAMPFTKVAMGLSFGVALSLVVIAGAELFTGNAFVMFNGLRLKTVTAGEVVDSLLPGQLVRRHRPVAAVSGGCRTGGGDGKSSGWCRCHEDGPAAAGAICQRHPVQCPRVSGCLVRFPDQKRCGQTHHGILVPLCILYLRI